MVAILTSLLTCLVRIMIVPCVLQQGIVVIELTVSLSCSHPEGATDAMQSSLSEPMLNNTGNASATQRLLEGQTDLATTTTKALAKPDAWVQAGKTLFQRATGTVMCRHQFAPCPAMGGYTLLQTLGC